MTPSSDGCRSSTPRTKASKASLVSPRTSRRGIGSIPTSTTRQLSLLTWHRGSFAHRDLCARQGPSRQTAGNGCRSSVWTVARHLYWRSLTSWTPTEFPSTTSIERVSAALKEADTSRRSIILAALAELSTRYMRKRPSARKERIRPSCFMTPDSAETCTWPVRRA